MKCEICHKNDAETAIEVNGDDGGRELYVCKRCAKKHKRESEACSFSEGDADETAMGRALPPGVSISMAGVIGPDGKMTSGGNMGEIPPQVLDMLDDFIKKVRGEEEESHKKSYEDWPVVDCNEFFPATMIVLGKVSLQASRFERKFEDLKKSLHEKNVELIDFTIDGIPECGHVYEIRHNNLSESELRSILKEVSGNELIASDTLIAHNFITLDDALCRALAVLKNCRLLTPGEFLDLATIVLFGLHMGYVSGISAGKILNCLMTLDLFETNGQNEDAIEQDEDEDGMIYEEAELADTVRSMFKGVKLNTNARRD